VVNININSFINKHITERERSFFEKDIEANKKKLAEEIENKSVLVIGGGGTIGSSFIKSILKFKPGKVVVVDTNENGLTELVRDVRSTHSLFVPAEFITYPVNFGNPIFEKIYQQYKPFNIIANFAAHKHVRSEKDVFSVEAMIQNNLFYANRLLQLIVKDQPSHFFCVSTDKAANPVNIMGATKKLMEDLIMQYASAIPCTTARFANVAFSNGSLLDGFLHRLIHRHPLSVPSDVKRYFVSPEESGEICMLASVLGQTGDIYFPKLELDHLTSFLDITESFLSRLGYQMDICNSEEEAKEKSLLLNSSSKKYPVYTFTSNTTGEKLYEEFYTHTETVDWNTFASMGVVKNDPTAFYGVIQETITELEQLFKTRSLEKKDIVNVLSCYIPNFDHIEKGITLDQKM
jgi:FlaA1/EpsC-like NDP-sugar epimerase